MKLMLPSLIEVRVEGIPSFSYPRDHKPWHRAGFRPKTPAYLSHSSHAYKPYFMLSFCYSSIKKCTKSDVNFLKYSLWLFLLLPLFISLPANSFCWNMRMMRAILPHIIIYLQHLCLFCYLLKFFYRSLHWLSQRDFVFFHSLFLSILLSLILKVPAVLAKNLYLVHCAVLLWLIKWLGNMASYLKSWTYPQTLAGHEKKQ